MRSLLLSAFSWVPSSLCFSRHWNISFIFPTPTVAGFGCCWFLLGAYRVLSSSPSGGSGEHKLPEVLCSLASKCPQSSFFFSWVCFISSWLDHNRSPSPWSVHWTSVSPQYSHPPGSAGLIWPAFAPSWASPRKGLACERACCRRILQWWRWGNLATHFFDWS